MDLNIKDLQEVLQPIRSSRRVWVISHYDPDADAYGSSLALWKGLKELGKEAFCINASGRVARYSFLPFFSEIKSSIKKLEEPDLICVCDCGDIKRVGDRLVETVKGHCCVVSLDHHFCGREFAHHNYIDVKASSTSEIVFRVLRSLDVEVSSDIASCLYAGIVGDTGSFRYSSTSKETLKNATSLVEFGARHVEIANGLYGEVSLPAIKVQGEALSNLRLHLNGKIAEILVTRDMFRKYGAGSEDTESLVEKARDIKGVIISFFIREGEDFLKVSLRSKREEVDISAIAQEFGGGGHRAAAGFRFRGELAELQKLLREKTTALLK